jgi:hypothetical protein
MPIQTFVVQTSNTGFQRLIIQWIIIVFKMSMYKNQNLNEYFRVIKTDVLRIIDLPMPYNTHKIL